MKNVKHHPEQKDSHEPMISGSVTKLFLRYLFPSVMATLLIAGNYLIDTICVGLKVGETGLAALNVVVPVTGLMYAAGFLFSFGSSNLFSNRMGEGKETTARQYYGTATVSLAVFSALVMIPGLVFNDQISYFLCAGAPFYEMSAEYLWYVFLFTPFYCFETYYGVYMRNDGAPMFSMLGTVCTCSTNIILDILFVWVFDWGMMGASLATGIALVIGFAVVFSGTLRKASQLKVWQCGVNFRLLNSILLNGAPDFLREISGSMVVLIVNMILLGISGETAVSAYGVIANLGNVVLCGLAGVSNTVQPLISFNYGAGRIDRGKKFLRLGVLTSALLASGYVVFAELFPDVLVSAFLDAPTAELAFLCRDGIRIISPGYVFAGISIVLNIYFEAVYAPGEAFWIAMIRGLVAPIICIAVFVSLLDVPGVWISFLAAELSSLLTAILLYRKVNKSILSEKHFFTQNE